MNIILRQSFALMGDIRSTDKDLEKMEQEQGFFVLPSLKLHFSLVNGDENLLLATGRLTSTNTLGKIKDILVTPGQTRKGYGTRIITGMENCARDHGIERIKATTQSNRASKLFEHCGYEPVLKIPLGVTLESHEDFEGGPQYEITFLKELKL